VVTITSLITEATFAITSGPITINVARVRAKYMVTTIHCIHLITPTSTLPAQGISFSDAFVGALTETVVKM
jgi:hypothetical protein